MPRVLTTAVAALAVTACFACGDDSTPTTPTPNPVTETFSGVIGRNGALSHPFTATASGQMSARLANVQPDANVRLGLGIGTWNGAICQVILANDSAVQGTEVIGQITTVGGTFCARVYDIGNLTQNTSYDVIVTRP